MVRLDTDPLQTSADADSISGGSENVCVCTCLICGGGHQLRLPPQWAATAALLNKQLTCQLLCYVVSCRMLFFVMCRHRTLRTNTLNYCVWHWWIRQLELLGLLRSEHYLWGWLWSKLCLQCLEQIGTRQVTLQVVGLLNLIKWI